MWAKWILPLGFLRMIRKSVGKTAATMLMSAMMALPAPLWARDGEPANHAGNEAKEGIPVILQPVQLEDGRTGYFVVAPYLESEERAVVEHFAKNDPKHLILGVSGPDDPALKFALESGNLPLITSYIAADASQANAIKRAPLSVREKIKSKIAGITELYKNKKKRIGLMTAVVASGIVAGFVTVHSSSLAVGVGAFGALAAWSGFQAVNSEKWDAYLHKGASLFRKWMVWSLGRDLDRHEYQFASTAGMFHATWIVNSVIAGGILIASGSSDGLSVDGILQPLWYGFLGSTDILDGAVSKKIKQGKLSPEFFDKFVIMRIIGAACAEVAGYAHLPHVQPALAMVTTGTVIYLALSHIVDPTVEARILPFIRRKADSPSCERLLSRRKGDQSLAKREAAE